MQVTYSMKPLLVLFVLFSATVSAQILKPVKWTTTIETLSASEFNLVFIANIDDHWHLYSQTVPENGPLPTVFVFENNSNIKLIGKPAEQKGKTVYEAVFEMKVTYFENKAVFKQKVKRLTNKPFAIVGEIEFMTCDNQQCIQEYEDFEIKL
ncbi:cytochrome C biogenesis protein [Tamlana fucoidanivorans]|uniref:Cytochrome C biogenesis protein n=1 Tax=Allotamlana fucoidanivorans TaxID=2583814 RepID=A0A5C4SGL2_9FLAO|nr:protein-disulfide reductase DsbD domain-containing protein [Tamlana fucoidanivorans]TNJ42573.1 cytochrome C biogenesis protein [Tamlana fucoidanivorans]